MAAQQKFYEGQEFHNPNDPNAPVLVYRGGKFIPQAADLAGQSNRLTTGEQKTVQDARDASRNAIDVLSTLTQFEDTNQVQPTGGVINNVVNWGSQLFDPEVQRLEGLTATIAPSKRQPGSGTTSDRDLALFLKGSPSLYKSRQTNDAIIEDGRREAIRRQQYADFLDNYAKQYGTLNGAEQAFRKVIGAGTRQSPYSVDEAGDRSQIPRGSYYRDPTGNMRRNDNGSRGNPIVQANSFAPSAPPKRQAPQAPVTSGSGWKIIP